MALGNLEVSSNTVLEIILESIWIMIGLSIYGFGIGNISAYLDYFNKEENEQREAEN